VDDGFVEPVGGHRGIKTVRDVAHRSRVDRFPASSMRRELVCTGGVAGLRPELAIEVGQVAISDGGGDLGDGGVGVIEQPVARRLVMPALFISIALTQIPFLVTDFVSLLNWNQLRPDDISFAGLSNYASVFASGDFLESLLATVTITGSAVALSLLLGLAFAMLLDRKFLGQGIVRTLMITPFLVMPAAAALIWKYSMLDVNVGMAQDSSRAVREPLLVVTACPGTPGTPGNARSLPHPRAG
jgi:hypothetical protein